MAQVNHLETIEVAAQSAGKSTAADDSDNQISQAIADRANILISTTSPVAVAASVYNRAYEFKLTNDGSPPVADFTVQFAARTSLHRGQIKVVNNTSFTATLEVTSQSSPKPTLEMGQTGYYDLFATEILEGPGSGGVGSAGDWKDSVRVATTANITLSGEQTLDGVLTSTDRVLVKDQSTGSENGLYLSGAGAWTRTTDADTDGKVTSGLSMHVEEGTNNGDKNFKLTTNDPIVLDTTSLTFTEFTGGGGLDNLDDTTITAAAEGDMLLRGSTEWENKSIDDLVEDTAPDKGADFVPSWDTSTGLMKKIKLGTALGSNIEASVKRTADLTGQDHSTAAAIAFNDENYDTDSWHDNSTNPSRLTVPTGVTAVDLSAHVKVTNITADEWALVQFYKNGTAIDGLAQRVETGGTERNISLTALGVECVATDYFELFLQVETDTSIDIDADSTFLARVSISGGANVGRERKYATATATLQTGLNFTGGGAVVAFDAAGDDPNGWHDPVTNNSRITVSDVPSGYVDVQAMIRFKNATADRWVFISIYKNGVTLGNATGNQINSSFPPVHVFRGRIPVTDGDYFEIHIEYQTDTSIDIFEAPVFLVQEWIDVVGGSTNTNALVVQHAVGDETTTITTGTAKATFRVPYAMTLTAVRASLTTASTSGAVTVDINEGGTSILSTKLTLDQDEKTSTTAATPPVISDTMLADDAEITVDVDNAGTGAAGLKVSLIGI
jgi:hypothetical protein